MTTDPKIVGVVGISGAGKDTVADFAMASIGSNQSISVSFADPIKEFARDVFDFSKKQLWGPSEFRNEVDGRYSVEDPPVLGFTPRQTLLQRLFNIKAKRPAPDSDRLRHVHASWVMAWQNFNLHAATWLQQVLPPGFPLEQGVLRLQHWMTKVMAQPSVTPRYVLQTLGTEFGRSVSDSIWTDACFRRIRPHLDAGKWVFIRDVRFLNEARILREAGAELWLVTRPNHQNGTSTAGVPGHESEKHQGSPEMLALVTAHFRNEGTLHDLADQVEGHLHGL